MADDGDVGGCSAPSSGGFLWDLGEVVSMYSMPDARGADANPAWLEKYARQIEQIGMAPAAYAARFSVPVRIRLTRLDGR